MRRRAPAGASPFVVALMERYADRDAAHLAGHYDDGAALEADFLNREVVADRQAWIQLVTRRTLPTLLEFRRYVIRAAYRPERHDLDSLVWAVGIACADLPLVDAPADWRHAPLTGRGWAQVYRFTRMPVHLDLADELQQAPTTPDRLQRVTRAREPELRAMLQACLMLGLGLWGDR
jgi:hypothetical protein